MLQVHDRCDYRPLVGYPSDRDAISRQVLLQEWVTLCTEIFPSASEFSFRMHDANAQAAGGHWQFDHNGELISDRLSPHAW